MILDARVLVVSDSTVLTRTALVPPGHVIRVSEFLPSDVSGRRPSSEAATELSRTRPTTVKVRPLSRMLDAGRWTL